MEAELQTALLSLPARGRRCRHIAAVCFEGCARCLAGLMGLIESEWLATLATIEVPSNHRHQHMPRRTDAARQPSLSTRGSGTETIGHRGQADEVIYTDFVECAHELAAELKAAGCDMVIALTHSRVSSRKLAPDHLLLASWRLRCKGKHTPSLTCRCRTTSDWRKSARSSI